MQVARTILEQLGGRRFIAMTGAKNFVGGQYTLTFSLPRGFATNKADKVRVTLTPADLYTVEFFKTRRLELVPIASHDGLYAEDLAGLFTAETGLDTHL